MAKAKLITLGTLIDETWLLYKKHAGAFLTISAWTLVVVILNVIALTLYPDADSVASTIFSPNTSFSGGETFGVFLYALTNYLIKPLLLIWVFGGLILFAQEALGRKTPQLKNIYKQSTQKLLPATVVIILSTAVILGAFLVAFGPSLIIGGVASLANSSALATLAAMIYIPSIFIATILAVRWGVHYSLLSPYSAFIDNTTGLNALKRSKKIVEGRFWQTVFLFGLPKIMAIFLGGTLMWLIIFSLRLLSAGFSGFDLNIYLRLFSILDELLPIFIGILLNPAIVIADTLLFRSLSK